MVAGRPMARGVGSPSCPSLRRRVHDCPSTARARAVSLVYRTGRKCPAAAALGRDGAAVRRRDAWTRTLKTRRGYPRASYVFYPYLTTGRAKHPIIPVYHVGGGGVRIWRFFTYKRRDRRGVVGLENNIGITRVSSRSVRSYEVFSIPIEERSDRSYTNQPHVNRIGVKKALCTRNSKSKNDRTLCIYAYTYGG